MKQLLKLNSFFSTADNPIDEDISIKKNSCLKLNKNISESKHEYHEMRTQILHPLQYQSL